MAGEHEELHKAYTLPGRKFNPIDNRLLKIIHENLVSKITCKKVVNVSVMSFEY